MATIVENANSGKRYVLLGTGFGAYQSKKPNAFFGDWVADTESGSREMVCVCNSDGTIGWMKSEDAKIVSVDGLPVRDLLPS